MTISIGAVVLSNELIWRNEFEQPVVAQSTRRKINGTMVIQNSPMQTRTEVVLGSQSAGTGFSGYFTRTQVQALKELERTQTTVSFVYEAQSLNVVVKAGGVEVEPILPRPNQGADDWYTGTITMIEV